MTLPPLKLPKHEAVASAIRAANDWYEGDILRDLGPRSGTIVDVGAHIGNHAVYWALHGAARVIAFEPLPRTFAYLSDNLRGHPNAWAIRCAISDRPGLLRMERDNVNWGRSRISPAGDTEVLATTLDAWAIPDVTLLKVDVEGWQASVLAGAVETLTRWVPDILIEDDHGNALEVLEDLGMVGYRLVKSYPGANYLYTWAP